MSAIRRWYEDFPALDQPDSTYAADLAARNDALFARVRALPPMIIFRTCHNCLSEFETRDPDDDLCPGCYHIYLAEQCPEALAEWEDEWPGHTCPECDGLGIVAGALLNWPSDSPPEYEELSCPACNGSGELTEPAGEPVVLDLRGLDDWYSVQERSDPFMQAED